MSRSSRLREPLTLLRRTLGPSGPRGARPEVWAHEYPMLGVLTMGSALAEGGNTEDESGRTSSEWLAIVNGHPMLPDLGDGENPARRPSARDRIRDREGRVFVIDGLPQLEGAGRIGNRRRATIFHLRTAEG